MTTDFGTLLEALDGQKSTFAPVAENDNNKKKKKWLIEGKRTLYTSKNERRFSQLCKKGTRCLESFFKNSP